MNRLALLGGALLTMIVSPIAALAGRGASLRDGIQWVGAGRGVSIPQFVDSRVIHDTGTALPIAEFVGTALSRLEQSVVKATSDAQAKRLAKLKPLVQYPFDTPMSVGRVERHPRASYDPQKPLLIPFFLIGSDEISLRWVAQHRESLKRMGAMGFLVQANSEDDLKQALAAAESIPVTPVPAGLIAQQYGLTHYPVLVTNRTVEQ